MSNQDNNNGFPPANRGDKLKADRINLLTGIQAVATLISSAVVIYFYCQTNAHWQTDPFSVAVIGILLVGGIAGCVITRVTLSKRLAKQEQISDAAIQDYVAEQLGTKSPVERETAGQTQLLQTATKIGVKQAFMLPSAAILFTISSIFTVIIAMFIHPFRFYETYLMTSIAVLPLSGAVIFTLIEKTPAWPYRPQTERTSPNATGISISTGSLYFSRTLLLLAVTLLFSSISLGLNQWLDRSPPQPHEFEILDKYVTSGRNHHRFHHIAIQGPTAPPIPFVDFGGIEDIHVQPSDYEYIVPGQSRVSLNILPGFFDFPWYSNDYSFSGLAEKTLQPTAKKDMPAQENLQQACQWRDHFDVSREIEKIAPDDYHRDYWPGGQPRSVEPLVKGKAHGIAHYTFANGQTYGDIPWKHGVKHGTFTLYREDGSREQALSYRDGHLFGINEWFKPDGTVAESWLYLNDQSYFPVSVCEENTPT